MTTIRDRLWCQATRLRSNGPWRRAKEKGGAKRAVMLPVSAPRSIAQLMAPAAAVMADALSHVDIDMSAPKVPLVANVTAHDRRALPLVIRNNLVDQVTGTVRWRESMVLDVGTWCDRDLGDWRGKGTVGHDPTD